MHRVIIDTDVAMGAPGSDIDDGFALALAVGLPDQRLELVTTVNGNTDVDTATTLALELLHRLGRDDVPVVRGAAVPLLRPQHEHPARERASEVPPTTRHAGNGRAAAAIVEHVMASPGEVTLVAIGPLTNVALALALEPAVARAVRSVVVMGGVFLGHTHQLRMPGEFNIWVDPDGAAVVLASGAPLRFVGLDVTRQVRLTAEQADAMVRDGGAFGRYAGECTRAWIDFLDTSHPGDTHTLGTCAMHDPLAVAVVSRPELVTWQPAHVAVETRGDVARGVTVADLLTSRTPPEANCEIATAVRADEFTELFLRSIAGVDPAATG
ncbi:nucleoside hydrolase [Pseudonocardia nigra]|uniref:nucleoside hydrolase n=1 Tax=Pseudonocardia nigra TaxID=1921578 RepID=UPI001C5DD9E8|nr:nucleoside hydrolase [Pseudonocardia nigra]